MVHNLQTSAGYPTQPETPKPAQNPDKTRLNLDILRTERDRIAELAKIERCSITELIRRAVKLFGMVMIHSEAGGKVVFRHADGTEETMRLL